MRKTTFSPGEHYHLFGRGNQKQKLFHDRRDWARFLFLVLYMQTPEQIHNISRIITRFIDSGDFRVTKKVLDKIILKREVELTSFCLMPNHFHVLVKEVKESGISNYMHRVLTSYAMYFNKKYDRVGHVFQGPFGSVWVKNNRQLLHLSAYIHLNPREIKQWHKKEEKYPWSSFGDMVRENRWGDLLVPDICVGQFESPKDYLNFVRTSGVKELKN